MQRWHSSLRRDGISLIMSTFRSNRKCASAFTDSVAEWSKASDSSSDGANRVGSNPTAVNLLWTTENCPLKEHGKTSWLPALFVHLLISVPIHLLLHLRHSNTKIAHHKYLMCSKEIMSEAWVAEAWDQFFFHLHFRRNIFLRKRKIPFLKFPQSENFRRVIYLLCSTKNKVYFWSEFFWVIRTTLVIYINL